MKINSLLLAAIAAVTCHFTAQAAQVVPTLEKVRIVQAAFLFQSHVASAGDPDLHETVRNITATTTINDAGTLLREQGSVEGLSYSHQASGLQHQWIVGSTPNPFPNPPTQIYDTVTVTYNLSVVVPDFNFDTGDLPMTWIPGENKYSVTLTDALQVTANAHFTYTLTTGGQTYTGDQTFSIPYVFRDASRLINTNNFPTSLSLQPALVLVPDLPDGILTLSTGSTPNGLTYAFVVIPEPSSAVLGALSLLLLMRRRRA
jgi:hypothetical protein